MQDCTGENGSDSGATDLLITHSGAHSFYETATKVGGRYVITALDPERAHKAVDDPGYTRFVENCGLCQAQAIATDQAEKA